MESDPKSIVMTGELSVSTTETNNNNNEQPSTVSMNEELHQDSCYKKCDTCRGEACATNFAGAAAGILCAGALAGVLVATILCCK